MLLTHAEILLSSFMYAIISMIFHQLIGFVAVGLVGTTGLSS
jgi:hypothetical protein